MRKQLTPEQIAKRDARREKMRGLVKQVSEMSPEQREQVAARFPVVTIEGRPLSVHNQCLIALQAAFSGPQSPTIVGGFRQWIKNGRAVRKGEHGFSIWVPIGAPKQDGTNELAAVEPGQEGETAKPRFMLATVFDVTQTNEIETQGTIAA